MKLFSTNRLAAVSFLFVLGLLCDEAASQSLVRPDWRILRNYSFIPSRSTLHVTGGLAGVDWDLSIRGKFGVVTGVESGVTCAAIGCPPPPRFPFARFVNVEATAFDPKTIFDPRVMSPVNWPNLDLEDTLNLMGLRGTFRETAPNHLMFHGEDGQGAPIKIAAVIRGPLIRLTGENVPNCAGCADYFGYKLDAVGYRRPHADVNFDGAVDVADYVMWSKTAVQSGGSGGSSDEVVDYQTWRTQFGDVTDFSLVDDAAFNSVAVPEPATWLLLLLVPFLPVLSRRRRR
jgi:hypothetical protein